MLVRFLGCGGAFGLMFAAIAIGNILESSGRVSFETMGPHGRTAVACLFLGLFVLMGFAIIPFAIRFFIVGQTKIGNGELAAIQFLRQHENRVVLGIWIFYLLGWIFVAFLAGDQILQDFAWSSGTQGT